MGHSRPPGVEHGGDADARAEMFWIGSNRQQRLRRGFEQQVINDRLVLEGDVGHLGRQREHDVEVADRKKVGLALRKPCPRSSALALWTVPVAARVIGDPPLAAVFTSFDMPAKRCGAAVLDRPTSPSTGRGSDARHGRSDIQDQQHGRYRRPQARSSWLSCQAQTLPL